MPACMDVDFMVIHGYPVIKIRSFRGTCHGGQETTRVICGLSSDRI